jgi:hypothetical protein
MPINGIETAYKDRYTFAPLSQRAAPIHWYTLPLRFIVRRSPEAYVRRPVFIGDFSALVRRQRILDEDALAEGEELDSNILSQNCE